MCANLSFFPPACCAVEKKENGNIDGEGWKDGTRNGTKEVLQQLCWSATQERVGLRFSKCASHVTPNHVTHAAEEPRQRHRHATKIPPPTTDDLQI